MFTYKKCLQVLSYTQLLCEIEIDGPLFIDPSWMCDGSYEPWGRGGTTISVDDKRKMCDFGVETFAENCEGEDASFQFNREEIQALGEDEVPTQGENFDFTCG